MIMEAEDLCSCLANEGHFVNFSLPESGHIVVLELLQGTQNQETRSEKVLTIKEAKEYYNQLIQFNYVDVGVMIYE